MNQDFQPNRQRPRRYKARPGTASQTNQAPSEMDSTTDETVDNGSSPDIAQEIAEARMAEQAATESSAPDAASAVSADSAPTSPNQNNQRPPRDGNNNNQQQQQARREADQVRREAENQRRQQEQQRRDQERRTRDDETRRRQQEQSRREAEDRARLPTEDLCKKAWEVYLAEVSEEGVELFPDNDARELARRSFRLAEIFLLEELKARRPVSPPREPREDKSAGTHSAPPSSAESGSQEPAPAQDAPAA